MYSVNPDLGLFVAEQTLIQKFKTTDTEIAQLNCLAEFCKLEPEDSKRFRTFLRIQRYKIDMAVADIVLMGLPKEMQDFVYGRYRDGKSFQRIAMELYVGEATLHKWNRIVLQAVATMSSYNLTEEDAYRPIVVRNMIHLLDLRINTFQETEKLEYSEVWLNSLIDKRRRYRKLLEALMEVQRVCREIDVTDSNYYRYQIINAKIRHNEENVSQLASRCGVSLTTVHRHLKSYMDGIQKYIA